MVTEQQQADIEQLLTEDRKIEAIKAYRDITGCGLKEAKDVIDEWEEGRGATHWGKNALASQNSPANMGKVIEALSSGRKLEAVKLYREVTGAGLKEAVDAVEQLQRKMHGISPEQEKPFGSGSNKDLNKVTNPGLAPNTNKKNMGGILFVLAVVTFFVIWWLI